MCLFSLDRLLLFLIHSNKRRKSMIPPFFLKKWWERHRNGRPVLTCLGSCRPWIKIHSIVLPTTHLIPLFFFVALKHIVIMAFGRKKEEPVVEEPATDPTGWLLDSGIAEVLIMNTVQIKYMCMLFYTFFHGKFCVVI